MELAGREVLVLGFGVTGRSAADYCVRRGARVVAADERPASQIPEAANLPGVVERHFGKPFPELGRFDLVIPSPGIPHARYAGKAKRAWGDIELCGQALTVPIVAVTGTNGKSTVVRLIEALANAAGLRARAAGNIGIPALDLVGQALDLAVLEVSSFQLESVEHFRPRTAVLLNVTPDHFDRHGDMAGYLAAKARLFARQGEGDHAIRNGDDRIACTAEIPPGVERLEFFRTEPARGTASGGRSGLDRRRSDRDPAWVEVPFDLARRSGRPRKADRERDGGAARPRLARGRARDRSRTGGDGAAGFPGPAPSLRPRRGDRGRHATTTTRRRRISARPPVPSKR